MDDEMLILLVQEREFIYNKKHPSFKNVDVKKNAWKEISTLIGITEEMCIRRWTSLRDRYVKERRQDNAPSGSGAKAKNQWPLLTSMDFLAPHILPRPMRCSYNITETTNQFISVNEVSEDTVGFPSCPSPPPLENHPKSKRKRKSSDIDELFAEAIEAFKDSCKQKKEIIADKENDAVHAWGKMIVLTVSSMSPPKRAKIMEKVTSLVMSTQFEVDS